jgi:hypothetical protein
MIGLDRALELLPFPGRRAHGLVFDPQFAGDDHDEPVVPGTVEGAQLMAETHSATKLFFFDLFPILRQFAAVFHALN